MLTEEDIKYFDEQMQLLFPRYKKVKTLSMQVRYQYEKTTICVCKAVYWRDEPADVLFLFHETRDYFSVAGIDFVINKKKKLSDDLGYLLRFLAEHHEEMLDYSFCNRCAEKFERYLKRKAFFKRIFCKNRF